MADAAGRGKWLTADAGPLFGLHVTVTRNPWRLSPAWSVVGGALASGVALADGGELLYLVGAVLLADAVWGGLWSMMAGGSGSADHADSWGLPYLQPAAPIMRISERLSELASGTGCRELLASVALALGLSALFGVLPLLLSLLVLACAGWAQISAERGHHPALPYALLVVGLPWTLGLSLAARGPWQMPISLAAMALGGAFTLLEWGAQHARVPGAHSAVGVWLGQAAVVCVLAAAWLPAAAGVAAALFLPPTWWFLRAHAQVDAACDGSACEVAIPLRVSFALVRSAWWWWLAFILAAVALRQLVVN